MSKLPLELMRFLLGRVAAILLHAGLVGNVFIQGDDAYPQTTILAVSEANFDWIT